MNMAFPLVTLMQYPTLKFSYALSISNTCLSMTHKHSSQNDKESTHLFIFIFPLLIFIPVHFWNTQTIDRSWSWQQNCYDMVYYARSATGA